MPPTKNPPIGGHKSFTARHSITLPAVQSARPPYLVTLPPAEQRRILLEHAAYVKECELCRKPFRRSEKRWVGVYQVDPRNNPDTLYVYCQHKKCMRQMTPDKLLAIEARAERDFADHLQALPTIGGAQ